MLPDYQQCGGTGGACNSSGYQCVDKQWSAVSCGKNSRCQRLSEDYHMCEPKVRADGAAKEAKPMKQGDITILQPWNQCGGKTGDCKEYGDNGCVDCPFPKTRCAEGHVCYRVVEHFWQCGPEEQYGDQALTCEGVAEAPAPGPAGGMWMFTGEDSEAERTCEAPMEGMAVQGMRFKAIQMKRGESNYDDCCESCGKEDQCVAFHLNQKSNTEVICALFSRFGDLVEHPKAVAGMMAGTAAATTAG